MTITDHNEYVVSECEQHVLGRSSFTYELIRSTYEATDRGDRFVRAVLAANELGLDFVKACAAKVVTAVSMRADAVRVAREWLESNPNVPVRLEELEKLIDES